MANHLKMAQVQAIQVLRERGWSYRRIARELGIHRDTVKRYIESGPAAAVAAPWPGSKGVRLIYVRSTIALASRPTRAR
jgi:transposase